MVDQWETCEIQAVYSVDPQGSRGCFWAKASSPDGEYNAGDSADFPCGRPIRSTLDAQNALTPLVRELVQAGWDPTHLRGPNWFSHRFRRRIVPEGTG